MSDREEDMKNICVVCEQGFKKRYNLKRHMETIHNQWLEDPSDSQSCSDDNESESESMDDENSDESSEESENMDDDDDGSETSDEDEDEDEITFKLKKIFYDVMEETDNGDNVNNHILRDYVLSKAKKEFRTQIVDDISMVMMMRRDNRFRCLFKKIDKYRREHGDSISSAVERAVNKEKSILNKTAQEYADDIMNECQSETEDVAV